MEIENVGNTPSIETNSPPTPVSKIVLVVIIFIFSIVSAFAGGYYLKGLSIDQQTPSPSPIPLDETNISEEMTGIGAEIKSGREYYDDTIMAVTSELPRRVLVGTATRHEDGDGFNQNTRASFFDGENWTRKLLTKKYDNSSIHTNEIVSNWKIQIDPSRVLKQSVIGTLNIGDDKVSFDTGLITNNLGIRSLPGYTKFISTGVGELTIDGSKLPAKILYTSIYSNNSQEMQFYDTPLGLTTHWMAFWDEEENVYHVDSTLVAKPTDKYQTHQFGIMVDKAGKVSKTFDVNIVIDNENPPKTYKIKLGEPIFKDLTFEIGTSINKAPNNSYNWFMSEGVGEFGGIKGFGVVEYIHN